MNEPRVDAGRSEIPLRVDREDRLMLIWTDGHVAFTEEGRRELAPYFARAGIDLGTIKTRKQYLEARRATSPYFLEHLRSRLLMGVRTRG